MSIKPAAGQIAATNERFTFWHHLQAANLLTIDVRNTTTLDFGEGQPTAAIGGGYRMSNLDNNLGCSRFSAANINITDISATTMDTTNTVACSVIGSIDRKIDDGTPYNGSVIGGWGCESAASCTSVYVDQNTGRLIYDARF
ncbi:MAG: hypothetical protein HC788_01630 [Sphingopyxis sp.]|nr:hypothetical protein [Sphingopyxis sp.]